jgi:hypothetical protein
VCALIRQSGGPSVQPLLRPDADGGELLRLGDGLRRGDALHGAGAEGHVAALPVPQGRHRGAAQAHLRAAGREGRRHQLRHHQGRDPPAARHRPEPPPAARLPPHGHDGAGGLAPAARPARAIRQHPSRLAIRALPAPVSLLHLSLLHSFTSIPCINLRSLLHMQKKKRETDVVDLLPWHSIDASFGFCQLAMRAWDASVDDAVARARAAVLRMITGTASALLLPVPLVRCCCFSKSSNFSRSALKNGNHAELAWRELCTFPFAPLQFTFPSLQKFTLTAVRSCWLPRAQCTYAHA